MAYQVPESKRSIDQNKFEFNVPGDDRTYKVPKAKYLPLGAVEKLQGQSDVTLSDIIELFNDADAQVAIRRLDTEQLSALTEAWQNDSGVQLGESSASSSS